MSHQAMETGDLVKTLLKTEKDCRALRAEVAVLEKSRRFRARDVPAITDSSLDTSAVSASSKRRSIPIPMDTVSEMTAKAGEISVLLNQNKKLLRERKKLEDVLESTATDVAEAEDENVELKKLIGCTDEDSIAQLRDSIDAVAQANGLKHDIINALNDRETIYDLLKRQNGCLKEICSELEATEHLEEQIENISHDLAEKQAELESIRREVQAMQHLLGRKDQRLEKEKLVDEVAVAQNAETDRRVALYKLEKQQTSVRLNDMSIRHRAIQIAKLEKRIEMIGDALARNDDFQGDRVDIELFESLRKEILSLNRLHQETSARLDFLDADIAQLDRKANGLVHTTSNVEREAHRIEKEHKKFTHAQQREIQVEQDETEHEIKAIEREIEMLRNVTARKSDKTSNDSP